MSATDPRPELLKTFSVDVKMILRGDIRARNAVEASRMVGESLRALHETEGLTGTELRVGEITAKERRL